MCLDLKVALFFSASIDSKMADIGNASVLEHFLGEQDSRRR